MSTDDKAYLMVFGTRTFDDYDLLREKLDRYTSELGTVVVVTGEWRGIGYGTPNYIGADLLAERWAGERGWVYMRFPPQWEEFPNTPNGRKAALHARNREMVEFVREQRYRYAVAFWDGSSPGSTEVIELCRRHGITLKIVRYRDREDR